MDIKKALGEVIRAKRKQLKWSQEELAFKASIDRSFLSEIECSLKQASITTIQKIANAFNLKPSELLKEVEEHMDSN